MKKFLLSASMAVVFMVYIFFQRKSIQGFPSIQTQNSGQSAPNNSNISYKDGEFTGSGYDAFYGTVQVKAVITGGKLVDVQFLSYPSDRSNSVRINSSAMPSLTQEAIAAQSAQVNMVSGATDTSQAFVESLTSALAQAIITPGP
jgi:uncharacterized protein with FMN-binding domain